MKIVYVVIDLSSFGADWVERVTLLDHSAKQKQPEKECRAITCLIN